MYKIRVPNKNCDKAIEFFNKHGKYLKEHARDLHLINHLDMPKFYQIYDWVDDNDGIVKLALAQSKLKPIYESEEEIEYIKEINSRKIIKQSKYTDPDTGEVTIHTWTEYTPKYPEREKEIRTRILAELRVLREKKEKLDKKPSYTNRIKQFIRQLVWK